MSVTLSISHEQFTKATDGKFKGKRQTILTHIIDKSITNSIVDEVTDIISEWEDEHGDCPYVNIEKEEFEITGECVLNLMDNLENITFSAEEKALIEKDETYEIQFY